mmetsp:Transcript_10520/g.14186  ORF Transcript_10520/g.14186 Transcript_10520/m.14186 type:complete len:139 (-) Transcript_10520:334-750(-)
MKDIVGGDAEGDFSGPIEGKFFLFLDQVTDPQNFGSILRSALFIGVDGVIVNKTNACGLTPVVSKVSSGAIEFIPLYSVKFVSHFFDDAKKSPLNFKVISTSLDLDGSDSGAPEDAEQGSDIDDDGDDVINFGELDGE